MSNVNGIFQSEETTSRFQKDRSFRVDFPLKFHLNLEKKEKQSKEKLSLT